MYVGLRQFTNFGTNFPDLVREWMIHTGVCHYLVVIRTPQGRVFSYDFGPHETALMTRMEVTLTWWAVTPQPSAGCTRSLG